jgi:hypothetical protein
MRTALVLEFMRLNTEGWWLFVANAVRHIGAVGHR